MPPAAVDDADAYDVPPAGSLRIKGGSLKHQSSHSRKHHKKRSRAGEDSDERKGRHRDGDRSDRRSHRHRHEARAASSEATEASEAKEAGARSEEGSTSAHGSAEAGEGSGAGSDRAGSGSAQSKAPARRRLTKSEAKFEEARLKRLGQRVSKEASLSHKDRVEAFNTHLASLTEHFDMPKIGPG